MDTPIPPPGRPSVPLSRNGWNRCGHRGCGVGALALIAVAGLLATGCSRRGTNLPLTAAFDDGRRVGAVTVLWESTGDDRAFAGGARLAEPETRVRYRVDVSNRTEEKVFVRLSELRLVTDAGVAVATDPVRRECVLSPGETPSVLSGDVWVPRDKLDTVTAVDLSRFAAPLSDRDVRAYRSWLLQGRPGSEAQVDAEIAAQAAAPPCAG